MENNKEHSQTNQQFILSLCFHWETVFDYLPQSHKWFITLLWMQRRRKWLQVCLNDSETEADAEDETDNDHYYY